MLEFAQHGHKVFVACSTEKRYGNETHLLANNGISVLRIKTGDITSNPNYITKGLAIIRLQTIFINAIKKHYDDTNFDLIIYSTPPIQYNRIIKFLKKKSKAKTYLLLKDIFPQNAVDMGLLHKWNPIYWYFRMQEKRTYRLSDRIGCMSPANVRYLLSHNNFVLPQNVDVCANSLIDRGCIAQAEKAEIRSKVREKLSIAESDFLFIYGGNLGISQGLSFLLQILVNYAHQEKIKFLIVGKDGTWFHKIEYAVQGRAYSNVILHKRVSPEAFKEMLLASDMGLIFLNPKFTIPNFPSRLTSYIEIGLPVIACTDQVSDVGDVVEEAGCGFKVISGDLNGFGKAVNRIIYDKELLKAMSLNARQLFEESYTTKKSYATIMQLFAK